MNRFEVTKKVAMLGITANILLVVSKLTVGFISRSQAMIADGFNSAQDVFASFATYIGNRVASKPEDSDHPYGHGKAEYVFSMIISFSLILVAWQIFRSALDAIMTRDEFDFSWWLVAVAVGTIIIKVFLFLYSRSAGKREENLLIIANSEDHRNDIFVTSGTLLGIILGSRGVYWIDGAVGIAIAIWIGFSGTRIFSSAYSVLMDTNIDGKFKNEIWQEVEAIQGVDHVDSITAKPIGIGYILIVKLSVKGNMTVDESHGIAADVKERLKSCKRVDDVVVHVNPT